MDYSSAEFLVIIGTVVLISLLVAEICDCGRRLFTCDHSACNYSYSAFRGPVIWKEMFPDSTGDRQSPINIDSNYAMVIPSETVPPLDFSNEHHIPPCDLRLYNDGHCVTLYARWENECSPTLCGGCLGNDYKFINARFRWGPDDGEGSEHTVDSHMYAMEVQAMYVIANKCYRDLKQAADENSVLTISYFYQVVSIDNPYLKPIIDGLKSIRSPFACTDVGLLALSSLMPPFYRKYYMYNGSFTFPPCTEGVLWIIQPEPLGISSRQLRKFRKLNTIDGPMERNTRPVQPVNCRELGFYD